MKPATDDVLSDESRIASTFRDLVYSWGFPALLVVGAVLRFKFIHIAGFPNDIASFEAWAMQLAAHGPAGFYSTTSFNDYPPGYFYILGFIGWIWSSLFGAHDQGFSILQTLIKLPAVLFDLGVGALLYTLVCRYASRWWAMLAAGIFLVFPATIFISAEWGQVDSVAAFFALLAIYALLRSDDFERGRATIWIVGAWLALDYSLMIKPQAAVLLPLLVAFAFTDARRRNLRVIGTAYGIVAAIVLTIVLVEPFHPSNPAEAISWLIQRLTFATNVYPYNSINAFNLWAIDVRHWGSSQGAMFWQPDNTIVPGWVLGGAVIGLRESVWGVILVVVAVGLVVTRYVQVKTPQALLEGCAIALLSFFVLATRMHERYIYDGVLFTIACIPFARRYLWLAPALALIFYSNLIYSWQYIWHLTNHVNPVIFSDLNLWGPWSFGLSLANVLIFFSLGWSYLGATEELPAAREEEAGAIVPPRTRAWYDPREGLAALAKPLDAIVMWSFGIASFLLSFAIPKWYWKPDQKIFDEVYFARAAEEYLRNARIYENTHPPLSKLLITFSTMLFGGMPKGHGLGGWTFLNAIIGHFTNGDNAAGWRFLDVVSGALVVMLLFVFARKITGSTLWGAIAAFFLMVDGMHYVQSRIATPEGFVILFSLAAVYAFYRFWIASQAQERAQVIVPRWAYGVAIVASLAAGFAAMFLFDIVQHYLLRWPWFASWLVAGQTQGPGPIFVCAIYFALGFYLLARYKIFPKYFATGARELTYGEGSFSIDRGGAAEMHAADDTIVSKGRHTYEEDGLEITYRRDAVEYQTPVGSATYEDARTESNGTSEDGRRARRWLLYFTVALGLLVGTKWYGVMGFGVSFVIVTLIFLQRYYYAGRPALWGNSRAFRLDGTLVTILFVAMTVYGLVWVPDLARQSADPNEIHNVNDVVDRQYSMYDYHSHLVATHPYASKWFEWPFDYMPVAYYYEDHRSLDRTQSNPNLQCCIYEVTSMPNPINMWFGLLSVPLVGILAWRERSKGYALLIITYLLQWLPWMFSPRLAWEYHFYVDIPLICICNAIVLQRVWRWARTRESKQPWLSLAGRGGVIATVGLIAVAFVFFFPILSAWPLSYNAWHARMWLPTWIVGPG
jgi:dolichyl-phosphate-mannose--protein O-mannosyl transferase